MFIFSASGLTNHPVVGPIHNISVRVCPDKDKQWRGGFFYIYATSVSKKRQFSIDADQMYGTYLRTEL